MSDKFNNDFESWLNHSNSSNADNSYETDEYNRNNLDNKNNYNNYKFTSGEYSEDDNFGNEDNLLEDDVVIGSDNEEKFTRESKLDEENKRYKDPIYVNYEDRGDRYAQYADKRYVDQEIKKNKPKFGFLKATAFVLIGSLLGSFITTFIGNPLIDQNNGEALPLKNNIPISISANEELSVENAVAKKAIPSVVGIRVKGSTLDRFGREYNSEGIGSGVIVSEDGYILTNAHVVGENADSISVLFSDDSYSDAKVIWKDATLDLSVIKVDKKGLSAIEFSDSDAISIGDKAIAIGNPVGLNLQSTLTSGYISGLNRSITMENGLIMNGLIQTDASINSGNSGGALLNSEGKLIGINTAKVGNTDGIGFAIPSNIAHSIVEAIIKDGNFSNVTLGIRGGDLLNFKQYYADYSIKEKDGVFVTEVIPDTASYDAGIKARDIILSIDDKETKSMNKLKQILLGYRPGDKVKIVVDREGKHIELDLVFKANSPDI